jgi:RNA polymerase sigma-70 factor (ECF subfamily)
MKLTVGTGSDAARAEEAALMARVAAGDSGEPMVALYQRYGSPLYGLGLRLLGDRGMAEEMVQETFVRLWRSAGRFDAEKGSRCAPSPTRSPAASRSTCCGGRPHGR